MTDNKIYTRYMYSYPHKTAYRKIDAVNLNAVKSVFSTEKTIDTTLYMHIPFCRSKCGYCNLFSVIGKHEDFFDLYIEALKDHARRLKPLNIPFSNVIIGGGTPLILNTKQLNTLFYLAYSTLNIDLEQSFVAIETSPSDTDKIKADILKRHYVNRVSIGVQSFIDSELKILNRAHSTANVKTALNILKNANFPCLNIDIIYGIPSQTIDSLKHTIDCALNYLPDELFLYPLYLRNGSAITGSCHTDKYSLYLFARDYLVCHGYTQISMRRFCRTKNHYISSCGFENTVSIGAGGRSYIGNTHTCLPYSNRQDNCLQIIEEYIKSDDKLVMDFGYILNSDELKRRYIIKNLFTVNGLYLPEYTKAFNSDLFDEFEILNNFIKQDYCAISSDKIMLTPLGLSLSDYLAPMFISNDVKIKMEEWDFDDY